MRKQEGQTAPWSADPIFQEVYFCNVHRENDKVTRFIRDFYTPHVGSPHFEYNMVFARFINWPDTIRHIGYMHEHTPRQLEDVLNFLGEQGSKVWGGAYVITTHGQKMPKVKYLTEQVLTDIHNLGPLEYWARRGPTPTCSNVAETLQSVMGIGSFLAGQVVADLKNTPGHSLYRAEDRDTFVVAGPGSLRGLQWFLDGKTVTPVTFENSFRFARAYVDANWPVEVPPVDNQDLQNCLCEFDKYCRVATGTGRSKRKYEGT